LHNQYIATLTYYARKKPIERRMASPEQRIFHNSGAVALNPLLKPFLRR